MSKREIPVSNGPDKADLLRAVSNPKSHLHVMFRTPTEVLEAHVDFFEEITQDGVTFGLKGHLCVRRFAGRAICRHLRHRESERQTVASRAVRRLRWLRFNDRPRRVTARRPRPLAKESPHDRHLETSFPLLVFVGIVLGIWAVLSMISNRNSRAQDRLARMSRPQSLADIEDPAKRQERSSFQGLHGHGQGAVLAADAADRAGAERPEDQAGQRRLPQRRGRDGLLGHPLGVPGAVLPGRRWRSSCRGTADQLEDAAVRSSIFTGIGFYLPSIDPVVAAHASGRRRSS